jgi:predicted nucleic acid-binding protein
MTTASTAERPSAGVVVDANVLLDVIQDDPTWADWSGARLADALGRGVVVLDPIAFLAGKCFRAYRRRGGVRRAPLPDFYIGAHAAVTGRAVLTRDPAPYRTAFPGLKVIAP